MVGLLWQGFLQLNWAQSPPLGCFEAASSWFVRMAVVSELLLVKMGGGGGENNTKPKHWKTKPNVVITSSACLVDLGNNDLQNLIMFSVFHSSYNPESFFFNFYF